MQIISEFSTPPCVLDPWKMCVAVLHILMRRPNDTAVVLKATMRQYPHSMSLKPSVSKSFCSHLHIILVHNSASSLLTSPSKPTVTICVQNTELIRPKSVTLFAHNAGFKYSTVGYNIWAVIFERLERCLLLIMTHKSLGIGMENTKLLCWMQYIPTRQSPPILLHSQLPSSVIWSYKRSYTHMPPVSTNASSSTVYPCTVAATWMHLDFRTGSEF